MGDKIRLESHKGLSKGDPVKCRVRPGMRAFPAVVQYIEIGVGTGTEVTVIGGKSGRSAWRTFQWEAIEPIKKVRRKLPIGE